MPKKVDHQFSLFKHKVMAPKPKLPIDKKRIAELKAIIDKGDERGTLIMLQDWNDRLDAYEKRITNKKQNGKKNNRS